ncbi:unnamed protein product [Malus baccata var. baccata]
MRHQSTVDFSAIEAESVKALKLEPRVLTLSLLYAKNPVPTTNSGEFVAVDCTDPFEPKPSGPPSKIACFIDRIA